MRSNLPVTQHERTFSARERLISTTDLHGKITYCNDAFVAISGFAREELLGQPHNLVRHPDMPGAVFAHMWDTLKQGKPWMGLVKNRCKQGDFYWVSAYVTPIYENNQMIGYESVRTLPSQAQKARASALYAWETPSAALAVLDRRLASVLAVVAGGGCVAPGPVVVARLAGHAAECGKSVCRRCRAVVSPTPGHA